MEYNEDRELTRYVWDFYVRLMTPFEQRIGRAIMIRAKTRDAGSPGAAEAFRRWGEAGVPEVEAALAAGPEAFQRQVRDRLLRECDAEVFVNCCPRCARVVRTPRARQRFWCGFDWHNQ